MIIGTSWHCLVRYLLAGGFVFTAGHGQYRLIYLLLAGAPSRASLAWALHFVLGTLWTHALHQGFAFRHGPRQPYWNSLARTSSAYLVLGAMSTTMMLVLCNLGG
ncbi:MAG: hypothetical protein VR64_10515 [Desulfatitalea sp. BRH_c12]|nr:MAG: hypothetical protein VR64_10515 [Desulfatitalea sp. BRH_c12]